MSNNFKGCLFHTTDFWQSEAEHNVFLNFYQVENLSFSAQYFIISILNHELNYEQNHFLYHALNIQLLRNQSQNTVEPIGDQEPMVSRLLKKQKRNRIKKEQDGSKIGPLALNGGQMCINFPPFYCLNVYMQDMDLKK